MLSKAGAVLLTALHVVAQPSYGTTQSCEDIESYEATQSYEDSKSSYGFAYHGCAVVDLDRFTDPIIFEDENLTHQQCQSACQGQQIAALFPDSCRCGIDTDAFVPLDSSVCDYPCMGDPSQGMCGSICPDKGPGVSTIYINTNVEIEYSGGGDDDDVVPPAEPEVSLSSLVTTFSQFSILSHMSSSTPSATDPPASSTEPLAGSVHKTTRTKSSSTTTTSSEIVSNTYESVSTSGYTMSYNMTVSETVTGPTPSDIVWRDDPPVPSEVPGLAAPFPRPSAICMLCGAAFVMLAAA